MKKPLRNLLIALLVLSLSSTLIFAQTVKVKEGDVLWKIARDNGVTVEELAEANNLHNKNLIHVGQELVIPTGEVEEETTIVTDDPEDLSSPTKEIKYVFYFIGDGLGSAQREMAELYLQQTTGDLNSSLVMNTLEEAGINSTYCADTMITDSAAAGTALASGIKTNKGVIGQDENGNSVTTLIEEAEKAGLATGLISTTRITHATPAAFAAHNESRNNENDIAVDISESGVDFIAGGGSRYFVPQEFEPEVGPDGASVKSKREDDIDLFGELESDGYTTIYGADAATTFTNTDFTKEDKVCALLTYSHLPYEVDRANLYPEIPTLAEMTKAGIDVLSRDEDGFMVMVEGGRIDHACHANDAAGTLFDTLAFDDAVKVGLDFYNAHPDETLLIVVGDHETGGLGLGFDNAGYFLDMSLIEDAKVSIADKLMYDSAYAYEANGDRDGYIASLEGLFGLIDLTEDELAMIEKGMDNVDAEIGIGYYNANAAAMAVTQVVSQRMNLNWTTTIHTGTLIPFTLQGVGADEFGGYVDNTDIANTLAQLLGLSLN